MVSMGLRAETEVTVLLPFCECAEERVLGDGSFGVVYKERYPGNAVAAKMKLRPLLQSMAGFCRRSRCMTGSTRAHNLHGACHLNYTALVADMRRVGPFQTASRIAPSPASGSRSGLA